MLTDIPSHSYTLTPDSPLRHESAKGYVRLLVGYISKGLTDDQLRLWFHYSPIIPRFPVQLARWLLSS